LEPARAKAVEGLGRRDLVDEVEIHVEHRRRAGVFANDVFAPDLLEQSPGAGAVGLTVAHGRPSCAARGVAGEAILSLASLASAVSFASSASAVTAGCASDATRMGFRALR